MTLLRWLTFLFGSLAVTLTFLPFWIYLFISSDASIFSAVAFPHWEVLIMLVSQFSLAFDQTQNGMCPLSLHGL